MKNALKYGIVIGASLSIWDAFNFFFLYKTVIGNISPLVILLILLVGMFTGMKMIKKYDHAGMITFGTASLSGVAITISASVIFGICTYIFNNIPNESFHHFAISQTEKVMKEKGKSDKEVKEEITRMKSLSPEDLAKGAFFGINILGIAAAFILAIFIRNKSINPEERIINSK